MWILGVAAILALITWIMITCTKLIARCLGIEPWMPFIPLSMWFTVLVIFFVGWIVDIGAIRESEFQWKIMLLVILASGFLIKDIIDIHYIWKMVNLPEATYRFPNGISFNHLGRFEVETKILGGIIHSASLDDRLKRCYDRSFHPGIYELLESEASSAQRMYSRMPPSYWVNFGKNMVGRTISNMYLHEKNSSKKTLKLAKTIIAGKEALLHEEYRYDDIYYDGIFKQEFFQRTMTVLFDDNFVTVNCVVRNKTKIDECRVIAEGIENSLKIPATSASEWSFSPAASSYKPAKPQISSSESKHYLTLGLQYGATQEEIRAAFQRITEQYHPDKDASMDASMKYHEARLAYNALVKGESFPWVSQ